MIRRGILLLLFPLALTSTGRGDPVHPVSGVVKLDGTALPGAMVTFCSDDGKTFSGTTDDAGSFKVVAGDRPGIPAGNYKVIVTKYAAVAGASENMKPGEGDYLKAMEKHKKDGEKSGKASGATMPGVPKGMLMPGSNTTSGTKSELPATYASTATTPFNFTVPLTSGPVTLDLQKGKEKDKDKDPKKK